MNREIKFRAWHKGQMETPAVLLGYGSLPNVLVRLPVGLYEKEPFVWMQFTGLKDKNDREIYEGDIVMWHSTNDWPGGANGLFLVEWQECHWVLRYYSMNTNPWYLGGDKKLEVVGNIYENPELLN